MKNKALEFFVAVFVTVSFLTGCSKNDTHFYEDPENPPLGIFSNTGNNILTCFINGHAWRTVDRTTDIFSSWAWLEVKVTKTNSGILPDTLQIVWEGYFGNPDTGIEQLILHLAVPANFTYDSFAGFNGQRLKIDSAVNGYFTTGALGNSLLKANGNIYFHQVSIDSWPQGATGKMSGLFDAECSSFKITNGRFDHELTAGQLHF
jgi:hypothetical protein